MSKISQHTQWTCDGFHSHSPVDAHLPTHIYRSVSTVFTVASLYMSNVQPLSEMSACLCPDWPSFNCNQMIFSQSDKKQFHIQQVTPTYDWITDLHRRKEPDVKCLKRKWGWLSGGEPSWGRDAAIHRSIASEPGILTVYSLSVPSFIPIPTIISSSPFLLPGAYLLKTNAKLANLRCVFHASVNNTKCSHQCRRASVIV